MAERRWKTPFVCDVFKSSGADLGQVTLPGDIVHLQSQGELAWAVIRDEHGLVTSNASS